MRFQSGKRNPCPANLHLLFDGYDSGGDEFERRERERQRKALLPDIRAKTYVLKARGRLGEYDFGRHRFPVQVDGLGHCKGPETPYTRLRLLDDEVITIGLVPARIHKARIMKAKVREWDSGDLTIHIPVPEDEARDFREKTSGLSVEVAFKVRSSKVDRWEQRGLLLPSDNGAGPLINARVVARRITAGATVLLDDAPSKAPR